MPERIELRITRMGGQGELEDWKIVRFVDCCQILRLAEGGLNVARRYRIKSQRRVTQVSDVIAEHQLLRVWLEIQLAGEVGHVVDADVVPQQRDRDDERHEAGAVVLDGGKQLGFGRAVETILEVPNHVLKDVRVPASCGDRRERGHELFGVRALELLRRNAARDSDKSAEALIRVGRVRHENQLVRRMKGDERADVPLAAGTDCGAWSMRTRVR